VKAFVRIKNRTVRQAVLHLVRALDGNKAGPGAKVRVLDQRPMPQRGT
jgi:hypothetical protein